MEKSYILNDSIEKKLRKARIFSIEKQYDLTQKAAQLEQAELRAREQKAYILALMLGLVIIVLSAVLVLLIFSNRQKRKRLQTERQQRHLETQLLQEKALNEQKREVLLTKLKTKVGNTMEFNRLNMGMHEEEMQKAFMDKIHTQSVIAEEEWDAYIDEVNRLYDGRLRRLPQGYPHRPYHDGCDITECGLLLDMRKDTLYTRRKRIKARVGIPADVEVEDWIKKNITWL